MGSDSVAALSELLFGLAGTTGVLASALAPILVILTVVYLRAIDPHLEEAALLLGGWPAALRHVTLPMIWPGIAFGAMLVFLLALGEVGVPMFLRYPVFPVETLTQFAAFQDFGAATAAAAPLLVVAAVLVVLERTHLRERVYRLTARTPGARYAVVPLQRLAAPVLLAPLLAVGAVVLLPLGALVGASLAPGAWARAWAAGADALSRSLLLGAVGATLLAALGFLSGYMIRYRALGSWRALDTLTLLLFVLPGTVIGVGLIALWNRPALDAVYGTSAMMVLAYVAQYVALTSRISAAGLRNLPDSLEEAGRVAGAPWLDRLRELVLPSALPGLLASWAIAFVLCVRDLGASMLVYPPGADPLAVRIFTLMANGPPPLIAALATMLLLAAVGPIAALAAVLPLWSRRRG